MPEAPDLTIRETAALSGVSRTTIEKAVEARVLRTVTGPSRFRGSASRFLPLPAVAYFHALKSARLTGLPLPHKKAIWRQLKQLEPMHLETIEFAPGTTLDMELLAKETLTNAARYTAARDRYITSDPGILGGTPVIRGTRITVYSVLGRRQGGDTIEELVEENPDIPREAFEAAELYATAHPLRGRPSGRPWRNAD